MAMGYPQNTYEQQRTLTKSSKKTELVNQIQTLENCIKEKVKNNEEVKAQFSFVEMVTNFVIQFFTKNILQKEIATIKHSKDMNVEYLAVKKEFEFCIIG